MSEQETTQEDAQANELRSRLLCRVVDVESALLNAFQRFVEEQKNSLEDMMILAKEELSKMELFAPRVGQADEESQPTV